MEPGFLLSYWRPWDKDSSFVESWGNYIRDKSMAEYGASLVGEKIREASQEQTIAIQTASNRQIEAMTLMSEAQTNAIRQAAEAIGFKVQKELSFLNRRLDVSLEQQRLSLMLQKNISELLMIPDSEKERQQAITLGIQFFVNASKDSDLFDDALEEFLKAEQMKKQDYFVLHRIGCIYLYTEKHLNPQLAFDYFARAGKYAAVESNPDALRLANILTNPVNEEYTKLTSDPKQIMLLAADSYEKAALASYVIGDNEKSVSYQEKALKYDESAKNGFTLAKYLIRSGNTDQAIKRLDWAIDKDPMMIDAVFCDADITREPQAIELVNRKNSELVNILEETIFDSFKSKPSDNPDECYSTLRYNEIATLDDNDTFVNKATALSAFRHNSLNETIEDLAKERASLADKLDTLYSGGFISMSDYSLNRHLLLERASSVDEYRESYSKVQNFLQEFRVKVGDKVKGGIIIEVNPSGKKGLMCADQVIGPTSFFRESDAGELYKLFKRWDKVDMFHIASNHSQIPSDFVFLPVEECKRCRIGGYNDWTLPGKSILEVAIRYAQDIVKGLDLWTGNLTKGSITSSCSVDFYEGNEDKMIVAIFDRDSSGQIILKSYLRHSNLGYVLSDKKHILPVRVFNFE